MRLVSRVVFVLGVVFLATDVASAQMGMGGSRMGSGAKGPGMMGGGMGRGGQPGQQAAPQITQQKAGELAQQYADQYLKGYSVERVLPFTGTRGMAYSVEMKGPAGQMRTLHVDPWGDVVPFETSQRRPG